VLNYPVIRIKPTKLFYYIDGKITDQHTTFDMQIEDNLILEKDSIFRIVLKKYIKLDDLYIEVEYENIFGNRYQKAIEFIAPPKDNPPEGSLLGTFLSGKVSLSPAERVK